MPEEFRDLTTARTGGMALEPVARLRTHRRTTVLVDPKRRPVAEIDEDEVRAFFDHHQEPRDSWREVEIELIGGRHRDLKRLARRLEQRGAHRALYPAKISRALGSSATSPLVPEVRPPRDTTDPVAAVFEARWRSQVLELIERDSGVRMEDPEAVHKMRVAAGRMRSALRTFRPLVEQAQARQMRDELAWLGGVLGTLRDAQVLGEHLGRLVDSLPASEVLGPVSAELGRHTAAARAVAGAAVLEAVRSERYVALLNAAQSFPDTARPVRAGA